MAPDAMEGFILFRVLAQGRSWTKMTLAKSVGKLKSQLVRDTAIFSPANIRWIFDSEKLTQKEVIDVFIDIIQKDPYLNKIWGDTETELLAALSLLIETFP